VSADAPARRPTIADPAKPTCRSPDRRRGDEDTDFAEVTMARQQMFGHSALAACEAPRKRPRITAERTGQTRSETVELCREGTATARAWPRGSSW
jgi:hypothetical protein